jgi:hypothetical protein
MYHRGRDKGIVWSGKYKHLTATVLLALLLAAGNATASNLDAFLDKCGGCHKKGAEAAPVNPADKAGLVWKKYFKRSRHPVDLSATMNSEEQEKVLAFLENHAADSDHPVAAIIPK